MIAAAMLAVLLAAQCPPQGTVVVPPDVGGCGYGFVMEVAGSNVDSALAQHGDESVERALPDDGAVRITFDRVIGHAGGPNCTPLRIVITATVGVRSGGCWTRSHSTILVGARLGITGGGDKPLVLDIQPVPDAIVVTSNAANQVEVERLITDTGPQLSEKLRTSIALDGLVALDRARQGVSRGELCANAYSLGFAWVLQVGGSLSPEPACVPRVFLQGDVFTLVVSREMLSELAEQEYKAGNIPKSMDAEGLIDPKGDVRVEGISVTIEPDTLIVDWHGRAPDASPVEARWRMGFVPALDGLGLRIQEITVNGTSKPVPKETINPFDEMIQSIAVGPKRTGLLASPMGRMRLTSGAISGDAILVAGRV